MMVYGAEVILTGEDYILDVNVRLCVFSVCACMCTSLYMRMCSSMCIVCDVYAHTCTYCVYHYTAHGKVLEG